jgi:uncharacterized membrane-anchored protein
MKEKKYFFALMILWFLIIAALAGYEQYRLIDKTIMIRIFPQETRSLFGKNQTSLKYEISDVNISQFADGNPQNGETVFVRLIKTDNYYKADKIYTIEPRGLYIKGKVKKNLWDFNNSDISIKYEIENLDIENLIDYLRKPLDKKRIFAEIELNSKGIAKLKSIYIDGEKTNFGAHNDN